MHELPIFKSMMEIILENAEQNNAARVVHVNLLIGELRDFVEDITQKYWNYISRGTICDGSAITITKVMAQYVCLDCGHKDNLSSCKDIHNPSCNACGSKKLRLLSGRELAIDEIEIELKSKV